MQLSTDEGRALAFIAALIGLALLGRWVDRPRPVLAGEETVNVAELRARSGPAPERRAGAGAGGRAGAAREQGPVDLNRASELELQALPGIGPALAGRIVAYRDSVGRFARPEELDAVRGVGPALLGKLLPLVHTPP